MQSKIFLTYVDQQTPHLTVSRQCWPAMRRYLDPTGLNWSKPKEGGDVLEIAMVCDDDCELEGVKIATAIDQMLEAFGVKQVEKNAADAPAAVEWAFDTAQFLSGSAKWRQKPEKRFLKPETS